MTRRELREQIFKILFQIDFYELEDLSEQLSYQVEEDLEISEKDAAYIRHKISAVTEHLIEIDAAINAVAKGWKTVRMGKVDLTLIRLAVYEIRHDEDIATGVAINEAVELAKKYGTDTSSSFVNGILARIA